MIDHLNEILARIWRRKPQSTETPLHGYLPDERPTQSNKPSNASSLSYTQALQIARNVKAMHGDAYITRIANTNSMEPYIDANTLLVLENLSKKAIERQPITVGDIISYDGNAAAYTGFHGWNILHRVAAINGDYIKFKGDNNFKSDGWIHKDAVIGRCLTIIYFRKQHGD